VKYKALCFFILIYFFPRTRLLRGSVDVFSRTVSQITHNHAIPPTSPLSRICSRRRGGSPPGDVVAPSVLSLRGWGPTALSWSPSTGRIREGAFPPLAIPMADEGEFTFAILLTLSAWFMRFVPTFRLSDVARGFVWDPLIPGRDLNSIPSRYLIDWGACSKNVP